MSIVYMIFPDDKLKLSVFLMVCCEHWSTFYVKRRLQ